MQIIIGNYDDGLDNLKKSYNLDKNEIKSFDVIMETCEFDKSTLLDEINKLSEENPKEEAYQVWLEGINKLDESNKDLSKVIIDEINTNIDVDTLDKDSYVYNYVEAWSYYNKGQYDKALEACNEAIVANPKYTNTFGILITKILIATENPDKLKDILEQLYIMNHLIII